MRTAAEIKHDFHQLSNLDRDEFRHWIDVQQDTQEIIELVVRLTQSYTIWRMLTDRKSAEEYKDVKSEYMDFFEPVEHVLLWEGFFVICAQIFDHDSGRHRSKHIHALIAELKLENAKLATELESEVSKAKPVLDTVRTVRNKISAHRQAGLNPQLVLKVIEPVITELEEAMNFAQKIVSKVADALGVENANDVGQRISRCQDSTRTATFQVLQVLSSELNRNNSTVD